MCSAYWNLRAMVECPHCGRADNCVLQTHFMGEIGACVTYFYLGEPVEYLEGWTGVMDGTHDEDDFIYFCPNCREFCPFGGRVEDGVVTEVWHLPHDSDNN